MPEIQKSFLLDNLNKITKNYNSKDESNTPVLNTIFNWFDTNHNGTFNEDEWVKKEKYVQDLQKKLNTNYNESSDNESDVVKFYRNKLDAKLKEVKEIDNKISKIYEKENYYIQMQAFEKAQGIKRDGYTKKSEIPNDATDVDISMFEMGILDKKGENFTGKAYKKGYITFPDNISKEEKQAYLELLKKTQDQCKQVQILMYKWEQLQKECDIAIDDYNKAKSGQIKNIGSQNNEVQASQKNQAIRESSNPYYKQYKEIEQKYNQLRLKQDLTSEEAARLVQYSQILRQLSSANNPISSSNVKSSKSDTDSKTESESETESNNGFRITNYEEKLSYDDGKFSDEHYFGAEYSHNKWNIYVTGSETEKYQKGKTEHEGFFNLGGTYNWGKVSISPELGFSSTDTSTTWTPSVRTSYNGSSNSLNFKASREITTVKKGANDSDKKEENQSGTTFTTNFELEWQKLFKNGIVTNATSSVKLDKIQGNEYSIGGGVQAPLLKNKLSKHNLSWTVGGNITGIYNSLLQATNINPTISTALSYNKNDFSAELSCQENLSNIFVEGESFLNQMHTISGSVGYKQVSFKAGYSGITNSCSDMTTLDAEVSWATKKAGTFSATCSYTNTEMKDSGETDKGINVSLGYSLPVDFINNLFKKSKKKQCP